VGDMVTGHGTWMDAFMEDHCSPVLGESETALGNFSFLLACLCLCVLCLFVLTPSVLANGSIKPGQLDVTSG